MWPGAETYPTAPAVDPDGLDERLLGIRPQQVLLELTSRCNLRCIYCAVSQPDYKGSDLQITREEVVEQIVSLGPSEFQISGHGETTLIPGWVELAQALLKRGLAVTMISHMNKNLSEEEVDAFSRFKRITVSCDTHDPAVYQRLRRGGRLERVANNIRRIIAACGRDGVPQPHIGLNCTATHINILGVPDLVNWAADLGASSVALTNLEEYPEIPNVEKPIHPAKVDPVGALAALRKGGEIAAARGIDYYPMGDLEAALVAAVKELEARGGTPAAGVAANGARGIDDAPAGGR
ncbi:MAG TPA: radical SAM protein [Planctomycetota bacterium]|nr:radical SAM protein [Planctomycetota bacterium]